MNFFLFFFFFFYLILFEIFTFDNFTISFIWSWKFLKLIISSMFYFIISYYILSYALHKFLTVLFILSTSLCNILDSNNTLNHDNLRMQSRKRNSHIQPRITTLKYSVYILHSPLYIFHFPSLSFTLIPSYLKFILAFFHRIMLKRWRSKRNISNETFNIIHVIFSSLIAESWILNDI